MFDTFFPAEWSTLKKLLVLVAILKKQKKSKAETSEQTKAENTEGNNADS